MMIDKMTASRLNSYLSRLAPEQTISLTTFGAVLRLPPGWIVITQDYTFPMKTTQPEA